MFDVLRTTARRLGSGALDLAMPHVCAGCRATLRGSRPGDTRLEGVLCRSCVGALSRFEGDGCARCQAEVQRAGRLCADCTDTMSTLDGCTAAVRFERAAERWMRDFKYPRSGLSGLVPGPESVSCALVHDAAALSCTAPPDVVIPVPLHPKRLATRGFNPAATLASRLAHTHRIDCSTHTLVRVRDTPSQTRLDRRARRANVRGAFSCRAPLTKHDVADLRVWLVDDVVTTGSTLEAAAHALRRAGAVHVHAICAARTEITRSANGGL
ncbi:MAG: phosphoribosyltransferase family protein [Myxococcota bacterium]|jgi:ComF family protein|nr:phosphoribosyltransferase family protein [Myxococcota bacterium]